MTYVSGKRIGPTFGDELAVAGLLGLPFAWSADGRFEINDAVMTPAQIDRLKTVIAAHDATKFTNPLAALWDANPLVRAAVLYLIDRFNEEPERPVAITSAQARQGVIDKGLGAAPGMAQAVAVRFAEPQARNGTHAGLAIAVAVRFQEPQRK